MHENIIFFDGDCPLCNKAVRHILDIDVNECFLFAPLNGETADDILSGPQEELRKANSLVLVEDYQSTNRKFWIRSRAVFRVYWLVGDGWWLIGIFSYLPGFLVDPLYRWIASHRHQFRLKTDKHLGSKERFLP